MFPSGRDCSLNYFGLDASLPLSVWRSKGWIARTIRGAGFNGIAAITWVAACRRRTRARSSDGTLSDDTSHRSSGTAQRVTPHVGRGSAKLCCTGPTTAASFEINVQGLLSRGQSHRCKPHRVCAIHPTRARHDQLRPRFDLCDRRPPEPRDGLLGSSLLPADAAHLVFRRTHLRSRTALTIHSRANSERSLARRCERVASATTADGRLGETDTLAAVR